MKRILQHIGVRPECLNDYIALHDHIWPELVTEIRAAHIQNYSIFYCNGQLTQYLEYTGDDLDGDMQRLAQSAVMQRWCAICKPMQIPSSGQWSDAQEVFYLH